MENYLDRYAIEREDFAARCLFTGALPQTPTCEHVIPKWMLRAYELNHCRFEMGSPNAIAKMKEFRVVADRASNSLFGSLEDRISRGEATSDETHLWHKKISAGMTLRHWCLSRNVSNPNAPPLLDEAVVPMVLRDFQGDFKKYRNASYTRTGSTISLPSPVLGGWLTHVIGGFAMDMGTTIHHCPYGLVATTVGERLDVSLLHDSDRDFEQMAATFAWSNKLSGCTDLLTLQRALAGALTNVLGKWAKELDLPLTAKSLFPMIAYQMGIEAADDGTWRCREGRPASRF